MRKLEENIKAILECNFVIAKEEVIEAATKRIMEQISRQKDELKKVTPQFAIDYILDECEDCPEYKDGECVTETHCFEVKQMCIKALKGELKGENK